MQPDSTHTGSHLTYIVKTQPAAIRFHAVLRPPTFPTQEPARPQGPLDTIQQIGHCRLGIATVIAASPRISRAKQGLTTQITPPGLICHPWTRGVQPTETSKTFSRMRHSIKHCLHRLSGRSSDAIGRRQESSEVLIWMDPARGSRYLFSIPSIPWPRRRLPRRPNLHRHRAHLSAYLVFAVLRLVLAHRKAP